MTAMILMALLTPMFLITPSEAKTQKGKTVRPAIIVKWSQEKPSNMTQMVNLTDEAEKLIKTVVGRKGNLKTFNFTGGYRSTSESPVNATVNPLIYGVGCNNTAHFENPKCKDLLTWDIDKGIETPLDLNVNVSVQFLNQTIIVTLDLNRASSITWSQRKKLNPSKMKGPTAVVKQQCNFSAEITFMGYVAYALEDVRGDMPENNAFDIVYLKNETIGLEKRHNMLSYNVTGTFRHYQRCKSKEAERHKRIAFS
uniref:Putative da-p36 protein n=1 Tax=Rhipicephalus pulchellus TaxID=72859 RepID=L7LTL3_RHIPC